MFRIGISVLLALAVMALTANYLAPAGAWYGHPIHPYITYGVMGAALFIPAFWALSHVMLGVVMGISGGGLFEGIKLGLILGLGMALGRSWLNVAAMGAGMFIAQKPLLWVIGTGVAAVALLGLNAVIDFIWRQHQSGE